MKKLFYRTVQLIISQNFLPIEVVLSFFFLLGGIIFSLPAFIDVPVGPLWFGLDEATALLFSTASIVFGVVGFIALRNDNRLGLFLRRKISFVQFVFMFVLAALHINTFGLFSIGWILCICLAVIAGVVRLQLMER